MMPPLPLKNGSFHLVPSKVAKSGLMSFSSTIFLTKRLASRNSSVSKLGTSFPSFSVQRLPAPYHVSMMSYGLLEPRAPHLGMVMPQVSFWPLPSGSCSVNALATL